MLLELTASRRPHVAKFRQERCSSVQLWSLIGAPIPGIRQATPGRWRDLAAVLGRRQNARPASRPPANFANGPHAFPAPTCVPTTAQAASRAFPARRLGQFLDQKGAQHGLQLRHLAAGPAVGWPMSAAVRPAPENQYSTGAVLPLRARYRRHINPPARARHPVGALAAYWQIHPAAQSNLPHSTLRCADAPQMPDRPEKRSLRASGADVVRQFHFPRAQTEHRLLVHKD